MFVLIRQTWALTYKNLLVAAVRRPISTLIRAFIIPLALVLIISYAQYFFNPPQHFGIGAARPVLSLADALPRSSPSRSTVLFVYNGSTDGEINRVIGSLRPVIKAAGKTVEVRQHDDEVAKVCKSSQRGSSNCYAAVTFHSSPKEPKEGGRWNYTLRADISLGGTWDVTSPNNDAQVYLLPLQRELDQAINRITPDGDASAIQRIQQYPYTELTEEVRVSRTKSSYFRAAKDFFGVIFLIGMVGVVYQLTGSVASERENGLAQLIEAMMPNLARWQPQVVRMVSYHAAFSLIYVWGWLSIAVVLATVAFTNTSAAILIFYHLSVGLALTSYALVGAAFFKKAQLSGIITTVVAVVLAIIPQVLSDKKQTKLTVTALSLIFPSSNYVYFINYVARWELVGKRMNLLHVAPLDEDSDPKVPPFMLSGIILWVFIILQMIIYPLLALAIERFLFGTVSNARTVSAGGDPMEPTVRLQSFSKTYRHNWFKNIFKKKKDVYAVKSLTLDARRGQILMLLGRNGSGKSTTLDAIAGLSKVNSGRIDIDGTGGLGVVPQRNVLWDDLTVKEHVRVFNSLKTIATRATTQQMDDLIAACDLVPKTNARSKTLSGGQKRKLQLAMMFAGGSSVCCIDEVSSGLDPLSRRKIWDILLAQRGDRTIIMTTHFLDEADFLSDNIAILSNGTLEAEGPSASLKHQYGDAYRFMIPRTAASEAAAPIPAFAREETADHIVYTVSDASHNVLLIDALERQGIDNYRVAGPTLEQIFLRLAGDAPVSEAASEEAPVSTDMAHGKGASSHSDRGIDLHHGRRVSPWKQGWILYRKRVTIFRRNYIPICCAVAVALIGAGVSPLLLKYYEGISCDNPAKGDYRTYTPSERTLTHSAYRFKSVAGPASQVTTNTLKTLADLYAEPLGNRTRYSYYGAAAFQNVTDLNDRLQKVDTIGQFNQFVSDRHGSVSFGGFFLGEGSTPPTFAWEATLQGIEYPVLLQNMVNNMIGKVPIAVAYTDFDIPPSSQVFDFVGLIFIMYFSLVMACYPAFFALYPTIERIRNVRALHYSNGVRTLPLWLAHLFFDSLFVLFISSMTVLLLSVGSKLWYHLPFLFPVFLLYGLSSVLLSYVISMFAKSQLAAWALCTFGQVIMVLAYFGAYIGVAASVDSAELVPTFNKVHFTIGLISPIANLARALFIALNQFTITCDKRSGPGSIQQYGGVILYLVLQCVMLFCLLFWWDTRSSAASPLLSRLSRPKKSSTDPEKISHPAIPDISRELALAETLTTGLRVTHLSKRFARAAVPAVDDITFCVPPSSIFALLGPNGAGKSTAISLVRGDLPPTSPTPATDIRLDDTSILTHRAAARAHLGVCPQFDAADLLTVFEHLAFYALVRGIADPSHNANELIRAFALEPFRHALAHTLSGGTKRKLSLAIAMVGNPSVLLLDEPSTGLDAISKRTMWRALQSLSAGRSVLLTTHSMEEADALASRAAIMSSRILALDSCDALRARYGDVAHIQLVTADAPHTDEAQMQRLREWLRQDVDGAVVEEKSYCGLVRLTVPTAGGEVGRAIGVLERNRDALGVRCYSIADTTLDEVFVGIVRGEGGGEEERRELERTKRGWFGMKGNFSWGGGGF